MICPVVAYAPKAATKPSIAAQPLNFSASGVMMKSEMCMWTNVNELLNYVKPQKYGLPHEYGIKTQMTQMLCSKYGTLLPKTWIH